jgi:hypothetical protein
MTGGYFIAPARRLITNWRERHPGREIATRGGVIQLDERLRGGAMDFEDPPDLCL